VENKHWSPPNRGKETALRTPPLNQGEFPTMGCETAHACVVHPTNGETHGSMIKSMSQDPSAGPHEHRRNVALGSDMYGPAGRVQVTRAYADPTSSGKAMRKMPSAMGPQDNFRSGMGDGS
jgi:hypothetical protein